MELFAHRSGQEVQHRKYADDLHRYAQQTQLMKTQPGKYREERGSVLVMTVILGGILVFVLASYLTMIQTQSLSVSRSQSWNAALVVGEAGVEEALAHLN